MPASQTLSVQTRDGLALAAWRYPARGRRSRARVVIVHGYAEHAGRYAWLREALVAAGCDCDLFDLRGHGRSGGSRGHVARFADYVDDLNRIVACAEAAPRAASYPLFVIAHSLGGLVALEYVRLHPETIDGLVASSPFLAPAFRLPLLVDQLAALAARLVPLGTVKNRIEPAALSHEPSVAQAYSSDPLVFDTVTLGWWREVRRTQDELFEHASDIRLPVLFLLAQADRIADWQRAAAIFERLGSTDKSLKMYPNFFHEVLNEVGRDLVLHDLLTWVDGHTPGPSA